MNTIIKLRDAIFLEDRFNSIPRPKDEVHLKINDVENIESNKDILENFEPRKSKCHNLT